MGAHFVMQAHHRMDSDYVYGIEVYPTPNVARKTTLIEAMRRNRMNIVKQSIDPELPLDLPARQQ